MKNTGKARDAATARLNQLFNRARAQGAIIQGIILDVDKDNNTCTVEIDEAEYENIPIKVILDDSNFIVYPKIGTYCDVFFQSNNPQAPSILDFQEAESIAIDCNATIVFNGGQKGGLINIGALVEKLNDLVSTFNSHIHPATSGTTSPTKSQATVFNRNAIEDTQIKH